MRATPCGIDGQARTILARSVTTLISLEDLVDGSEVLRERWGPRRLAKARSCAPFETSSTAQLAAAAAAFRRMSRRRKLSIGRLRASDRDESPGSTPRAPERLASVFTARGRSCAGSAARAPQLTRPRQCPADPTVSNRFPGTKTRVLMFVCLSPQPAPSSAANALASTPSTPLSPPNAQSGPFQPSGAWPVSSSRVLTRLSPP